MRNLINAVKGLIKLPTVSIDNVFFRLHYQFTVIILIAFSLLVTSRQYFGKLIDCHFPDYPYGSLNDFCSVQPTYLEVIGTTHDVISPISPHQVRTSNQQREIKYYGYYQWVFIVLFIQAVFFSIPQYIWKVCEGGKMKTLAHDLTSPFLSKECITEKVDHLMDYFFMQLHAQNSYAYKYFGCELLNFVNVVAQICFMNAFIGEDFLLYGIYVTFFNQEAAHPNMTNPMKRVFPTITRCTFHKYGPSGSLENYEGLCILPENVVNEKIYIFLWFWFYVLAIISGIVVLYRIALLASPALRLYMFRKTCLMNFPDDVQLVHEQLQIGDWLLVHGLWKNTNPMIYKELITRIAHRIRFDV
ncbi:innexin Vnx-b17 [Ichnoviriform fugitivi]|uniref:Innexin Vnx-b17 n=1 Tax=Ichnoviriform fugitivi TaxID=265522 RepID=Q6PUP4_9VIRU|nr:innexin Vnx-b17 [Ichnoviriform fugitivi]AAS90271.1 innexin Vnx-b17 [Ichnoviriform fugitivi]